MKEYQVTPEEAEAILKAFQERFAKLGEKGTIRRGYPIQPSVGNAYFGKLAFMEGETLTSEVTGRRGQRGSADRFVTDGMVEYGIYTHTPQGEYRNTIFRYGGSNDSALVCLGNPKDRNDPNASVVHATGSAGVPLALEHIAEIK